MGGGRDKEIRRYLQEQGYEPGFIEWFLTCETRPKIELWALRRLSDIYGKGWRLKRELLNRGPYYGNE